MNELLFSFQMVIYYFRSRMNYIGPIRILTSLFAIWVDLHNPEYFDDQNLQTDIEDFWNKHL